MNPTGAQTIAKGRIVRLFFAYYLPAFAVFTLILIGFERFHWWSTQNQTTIKQEQFLHLFQQELKEELAHVITDLYLLSQDEDLIRIAADAPPSVQTNKAGALMVGFVFIRLI